MKKAVSLLSSGIDSPVASYLMMEKGLDLIFIHFDNGSLSKNTIPKVKKILALFSKKFNRKLKLYIVPHEKNQLEIKNKCNNRYQCILCKRFMMKIATAIAAKEKASLIVTGENLSQVASQTLDNMAVIDSSTNLIILRPLLCMDKQESIDLAKKIGTYDLSIEKHIPCLIVPKDPMTKSNIKKVEFEESKLDINNLIDDAISHSEIFLL